MQCFERSSIIVEIRRPNAVAEVFHQDPFVRFTVQQGQRLIGNSHIRIEHTFNTAYGPYRWNLLCSYRIENLLGFL